MGRTMAITSTSTSTAAVLRGCSAEDGAEYRRNIRAAWDVAHVTWAARAMTWYADYRARVLTVSAGLPIMPHNAIVASALGSINSDPSRALGWLVAYVTRTGRYGHVAAVMSRADLVLTAETFELAREMMLTPGSDARKVRCFACNIETAGRPCSHGKSCVTVDRWAHRIATNWERDDVPQGPLYDALAQAYRDVAADLGIAPAVLQAVTWEAVATCEHGGRSGRKGCACSACSTVREHRSAETTAEIVH